MVTGYDSAFIFYFAVFEDGCEHLRCQTEVGKDPSSISWFSGGPSIRSVPLPVPDPNRPWNSTVCDDCNGFCAGHYLEPKKALATGSAAACSPPSTIIEKAIKSGQYVEEELAKKSSFAIQ